MRLAAILALLSCSCAPGVTRSITSRTNVQLIFSSAGGCAADCRRRVAADLGRTFARYDVAFWTEPDARRVDGVTIFFEAGSSAGWEGAVERTVGLSPVRCAPETRGDVITGASVVWCGDRDSYFCAGVAAHEIGHLLGLEHVRARADMMSATYRIGNRFGAAPAATIEGRCRPVQDDAELLFSALGEAREIF